MGTTHSTKIYGLKLGPFNLLIIYIIKEYVNGCANIFVKEELATLTDVVKV